MEIKEFHNLNLFWKVNMKYNFNQISNSLQKSTLFYGVKTNSTNLVSNLNFKRIRIWKLDLGLIWKWALAHWPAQPTWLALPNRLDPGSVKPTQSSSPRSHTSLPHPSTSPATEVAACESQLSPEVSAAATWAYDVPQCHLPPPPLGFGGQPLCKEIPCPA
jgi:hypothetical protein